ncbi:MAG: DNA polymerase I [Actinomycetes bacterium]
MSEKDLDRGQLFVLDGMSLAFRAYFALPTTLATAEGVVTNAVHGFTSMLLSIIKEHRPKALAVAFDLPGGTFRDEMVEDYKGGRAETPEDLLPQFDMIKEIVESLGIPIVSLPGFEADDVLATLATRSREEHRHVVVVTGDRDCFQLVEDPFIRVLYNRKGVSDYVLYDEAGIQERTGLDPQRYPMLAALRGDKSDNLPGVPGVGEKTASKLLNTYGDLDGIFSHLDELTPKLRENLAANEELARHNERVMTLHRDIALKVDPADIEMGGWDRANAAAIFENFEMRSIWRRTTDLLDAGALGTGTAGNPSAAPSQGDETSESSSVASSPVPIEVTESDQPGLDDLASRAANAVHTVALGASNSRIGFALPGSLTVGTALLESGTADTILGSVFPVRSHDSKAIVRAGLDRGHAQPEPDGDAAIAGYLLDSAASSYSIDSLVDRHLPASFAMVEAGPTGQLALGEAAHDDRVAAEVVTVDALLAVLEPELEAKGLTSLYRDVELPLVKVLARMEHRGIAVDRSVLTEISTDLRSRIRELEASLHEFAGHPFNVNSTPQLRTVLFEELGLTPRKKTKTGFSTDAATLESMIDDHPIVRALLDYRELEKLRSTYGDSLLNEIAADGRIHATFRQTVARTGRLSSEQPNLHNIPVRSAEGRRFRAAFVPADGWELLVADYDQVELRIIAHLSQDHGLLDAFQSGQDIHRTTAAGVYGIDPEKVSHEQRERAKMVSYGLAYGMEAYGLSQRLGGDVAEAKEIMERFFAAFPGVKGYMDSVVAEATAQGFTRTELGRIRPLPELKSPQWAVRNAAERQAMNAGIQGLAADIFKIALIRLDRRLEQEGLAARIVLQVHDEVIVEAPAAERSSVEAAVLEELTGAASLRVPLKVSLGWGTSWAGAKG